MGQQLRCVSKSDHTLGDNPNRTTSKNLGSIKKSKRSYESTNSSN